MLTPNRSFFTKSIVFLAVFGLFSCTQVSRTNTASEMPSAEENFNKPLPLDPSIRTGTLDNGITWFVRHNEKPENRVELRLVVNAGSILETEKQQGLAHLVEHMAFNGTKDFEKQALVDYLESIGMRFGPDLNAYTSFDETVYMLQVPTDDPAILDTAFQILNNWAHYISFEDEEIDKERGVVIEEWRLGRGAEARMRDKQFPVLFKDSQYAVRLPIGQKAVIDTAHYETIRSFYRNWYRPDLMAIVAVGDLAPDTLEKLIHTHFSDIPTPESAPERTLYPVPDHEESLVTIATDPEATNTRVSVYYKHPLKDESTVGAYRESILGQLFNGMLNARLEELTQTADPPFRYAGSFYGRFIRTKNIYALYSGVRENGIERGMETLLTEAKRVRDHGFTEAELRREKQSYLRRIQKLYEERDKTQSRRLASEYIRHFLEDETVPGIEKEYELAQDLLPTISLDDLNALADQWITQENRVVLVNAPEKEDMIIPSEDQSLAIFDAVDDKIVEPYTEDLSDEPLVSNPPEPGKIVEEAYHAPVDVHEWTLSNGVIVLVKQTDFKNDEVLFTGYSDGGLSLVSDENYVSGMVADNIIRESGVGGFSSTDLRKKLAGKIVSVSPTIGSLREGMNGSASPQDLETMFQLIYLYFTEPRTDSTAYLAYLSNLRSMLENRHASPESAWRDTLQVTLAQHHWRERPWDVDMLEEIDLATAQEIYKDRFADAGDFTFIFVGNLDLEVLRPLAETWLGGLPTIDRQESWHDVGIDPPDGMVSKAVFKGLEPKSLTQIIFPTDFEWSAENAYRAETAMQAFRIKLREVLREEMSGTYGVGVWASPQRFPDEELEIGVVFGCSPDRVKDLTETVFIQIDSLQNEGLPQSYIDKVKEIQIRQFETDRKTNGFWRNQLKYVDINGLPFDYIIGVPERAKTITRDTIRETAGEAIDHSRFVQVTLYPEE